MATPASTPAVPPIQLLIADVDGTLVTQDKILTAQARQAVARLAAAGVRFTMTSGRPPRGMRMFFDTISGDIPIAAFNGGMFVRRDLSVVEQMDLPEQEARRAAEIIAAHGLDVWLYAGQDWLVEKADAPHVAREQFTVQFAPRVVEAFSAYFSQVIKVVGVSDDFAAVAACEADLQKQLDETVSASRSQPYYVDVTPPRANKGAVVEFMAALLRLPHAAIATIGDGPNDVFMFRKSGLSVAMGNADEAVQRAASCVTASNQDEGFAKAVEQFILPRGPGR